MITCSNTSKRGAILVFTALISTAILAVTAIVVDIGYLYYKKNDLQTAVNAAWLAGNDRLMKLKSVLLNSMAIWAICSISTKLNQRV